MSSNKMVVSTRIKVELAELERSIKRAAHLLSKAEMQNDEDYLDGVALNLHSFYTGAERIFRQIAKEVDGSIPTDSEWHRTLLMQMSGELATVRPQVIERETRACLDKYRGFRHIVRNVYTFNLLPSRLKELVTELQPCYNALRNDITIFCNFLDSLPTDD